jgi:hypothetical protein
MTPASKGRIVAIANSVGFTILVSSVLGVVFR